MEVVFYSTHCPRCEVLSKKMEKKGITFTEVNDVKEMRQLGFMSVPMLSVDGQIMDFSASIEWLDSLEG